MESVGARYGIWSVNPVGPDIATKALGTAEGINKLMQDRYKLMMDRYAAEKAGRTLEGDINLANIKSATDSQYYPKEAEAGLRSKYATIGETGAHSRLYDAEAKRARAMASLYGGIGLGGAGGGMGTPKVNPDGTITIESPTPASMTTAQNRIAAEAEMQKLMPIVTKGLNHYVGLAGKGQYLADIYRYKTKPNTPEGKAAAQRLYEYDLAQRYSTEAAGISARQATGQPAGVEALREFKNSMFRNSALLPQGITQKSLNAYSPLQQQVVGAAVNQERSGFPQNAATPPAWSQGGIQLNPMGSLGGRSSAKQGLIQGNPAQSTIDLGGIPDDVLQQIAGGGQ